MDEAMDADAGVAPKPLAAAVSAMAGSSSAAGASEDAPEVEVEVRLRKVNALSAKGLILASDALVLRLELVRKQVGIWACERNARARRPHSTGVGVASSGRRVDSSGACGRCLA